MYEDRPIVYDQLVEYTILNGPMKKLPSQPAPETNSRPKLRWRGALRVFAENPILMQVTGSSRTQEKVERTLQDRVNDSLHHFVENVYSLYHGEVRNFTCILCLRDDLGSCLLHKKRSNEIKRQIVSIKNLIATVLVRPGVLHVGGARGAVGGRARASSFWRLGGAVRKLWPGKITVRSQPYALIRPCERH